MINIEYKFSWKKHLIYYLKQIIQINLNSCYLRATRDSWFKLK